VNKVLIIEMTLCAALATTSPNLAQAVELVNMEIETQSLNLDTGTVATASLLDPTQPSAVDIKLAYNADRAIHVVVVPAAAGVEIAFIANVGFDGVSLADVPALSFSAEATDLPFSASDCVVIRTDQGALYRLGNAVENDLSVSFNYAALQ